MNNPHFTGRIINHANGQGAATLDDVRQRAKELARIDGRTGEDYSDGDWQRAKYELRGGHSNGESPDDEMEMTVGSDMIAGSLGHHVPNHSVDESEHAVAELIQEGLEEAEHEQMLAASLEEDGEDS